MLTLLHKGKGVQGVIFVVYVQRVGLAAGVGMAVAENVLCSGIDMDALGK